MQIRVRVTPAARKELFEVLPNNRFNIAVKSKAKDGAANVRVVELVAKHFKVPTKKVRLVRGHKTPSKILEVS